MLGKAWVLAYDEFSSADDLLKNEMIGFLKEESDITLRTRGYSQSYRYPDDFENHNLNNNELVETDGVYSFHRTHTSYFIKKFRIATSTPPHQYRLHNRVSPGKAEKGYTRVQN